MQLLRGLKGRAEFLAFVAEGSLLASAGSFTSAVRLWDLRTGKSRGLLQQRRPASGLTALAIRLFNAVTGQEGEVGESFPVAFLTASPDGSRLLVAHRTPVWLLWNTHTGQLIANLQSLPESARHGEPVAFAPDSRTFAGFVDYRDPALATGPGRRRIHQWNAETGQEADKPLVPQVRNDCTCLAFGCTGNTIATLARDVASIQVYRVPAPPEPPVEESPAGDFEIATLAIRKFSPDLSVVLMGHEQSAGEPRGSVALWDVATKTRRAELKGHRGTVTSAAFSPDSRVLATSCTDGTVRFWDTATGRERTAFDLGIGKLYSVVFAPDGMRAAAGGKGSIVVWDVEL